MKKEWKPVRNKLLLYINDEPAYLEIAKICKNPDEGEIWAFSGRIHKCHYFEHEIGKCSEINSNNAIRKAEELIYKDAQEKLTLLLTDVEELQNLQNACLSRRAKYINDGIELVGTVTNAEKYWDFCFVPDDNSCGFDSQYFNLRDIGKTIFFID